METNEMKPHNVPELLHVEIKRCLGLLSQYASRGPAGLHDHTMISEHIIVANEAMIEHDLPRMSISLKTLEGLQMRPTRKRGTGAPPWSH